MGDWAWGDGGVRGPELFLSHVYKISSISKSINQKAIPSLAEQTPHLNIEKKLNLKVQEGQKGRGRPTTGGVT